jgi:predicted nuclease of predicted toxin-antitoxin system
MLNFLPDENIPFSATATLHEQGYVAHHVRDLGLLGASDETIYDRAQEEGWVIVTRDLDFGNLLDYPLGTHFGTARRMWYTRPVLT